MTRSATALILGSAAVSLGLMGCSNQAGTSAPGTFQRYSYYTDTSVAGHPAPAEQPAPKPAPKAEAKAEPKPAPAPAPAGTCGPGMAQTSLMLPTGERSTSVLGIDRCMPTEVVAGQNFNYTYKVCNLTRNTVSNVILRDNCMPPMQVVGSQPAAQGTSPALMWNLGDLAPGECKTVTVTAKAGASGTVGTCATAEWAQTFCQQVAVVQPALKVDLAMQPAALKCDKICGKVTVTNTGTGMTRNATATVNLPKDFTTTDGKTGAVTFNAGDLAAGQSKSFDICGTVKATGNFCSTASAAAEGGLTASAAQACTTVTAPALKMTAECPASGVVGRGGRNLTFKFTVTNTGNAACGVTVTAPVPAGTTFVSADNGGTGAANVSWNVGNLAPNASKTVSMTVKANTAGTFAASATATCACADPATANCSTSTTGVPDIGTQITDDDGVVEVGANHNFRYEVKNQGLVDLTNVKMVATLDEGLEFVSSDWTSPAQVSGRTVTWNIGTLKVGDIKKFNILCKGTKAGQLVIQSVTTADQTKLVRNDEQVNYIGN